MRGEGLTDGKCILPDLQGADRLPPGQLQSLLHALSASHPGRQDDLGRFGEEGPGTEAERPRRQLDVWPLGARGLSTGDDLRTVSPPEKVMRPRLQRSNQ